MNVGFIIYIHFVFFFILTYVFDSWMGGLKKERVDVLLFTLCTYVCTIVNLYEFHFTCVWVFIC